jgi:hypothetical protein
MRTRTKQGIQVLRRVHDFLAATDVPAALGSVTKHVEALGRLVDRLSAHAVEQDASARAFSASARAAQQQTRALRREFMRPVVRLGKSFVPNDPSLRKALAMPDAQDYEGVIAAALAMAERAEEHKDRFVAAGFGEDFVDRLRKAVAGLRSTLDDRSDHFGRRSAATAGLGEEMARGRDLVRLLDAMVAPRLEDAPDRLAQWRTLARFVRVTPPVEEGTTVPAVVPPNVPTVVAPNVASAAVSVAPLERAA